MHSTSIVTPIAAVSGPHETAGTLQGGHGGGSLAWGHSRTRPARRFFFVPRPPNWERPQTRRTRVPRRSREPFCSPPPIVPKIPDAGRARTAPGRAGQGRQGRACGGCFVTVRTCSHHLAAPPAGRPPAYRPRHATHATSQHMQRYTIGALASPQGFPACRPELLYRPSAAAPR